MVNDRADDLLPDPSMANGWPPTGWIWSALPVPLVIMATRITCRLYRNYAIDSFFNSDLPLDQFTREQLGGDLLEKPTNEQLVATGYNRLLQLLTREAFM